MVLKLGNLTMLWTDFWEFHFTSVPVPASNMCVVISLHFLQRKTRTKLDEPLYVFFLLLYVNRCIVCTYVCVSVAAWGPWRAEEGIRSSGSGVTDGFKPPCRCWELNPAAPALDRCASSPTPVLYSERQKFLFETLLYLFKHNFLVFLEICVLSSRKDVSAGILAQV